MLSAFMTKNTLPDEFKLLVENSYLPLAERIFSKYKEQGSPYFIGLNGCQGSGKSTLSEYIAEYLSSTHKLNVVVMSLDDFYLSKKARNELAENIHPLFNTRGVPGTHDTVLLHKVINHLKNEQTGFSIPRFNKATDNPHPKELWEPIEKPIDIIIVEGWCWGVTSQNEAQLLEPVNELEQQYDSKAIWRTYVNDQLKLHYQPLYQHMDFWVALEAPCFNSVYKWRLEQEQKLANRLSLAEHSDIMNAEQIFNFIQYFQRLTIHGTSTLPSIANDIFYLDEYRNIATHVQKD